MISSVKHILIGALAIGGLSMASCTKSTEFLGEWTAETPADITRNVPAATKATSTMSLNFALNDSVRGGKGGPLLITSIISVTQPVEPGVDIEQGYEVNVAATASISGTWRYEDDSDEDLILSLDPSSLNVDIDNNGVTFTQNILTGAQQPTIDSLTTATATQWKAELTKAMRSEFSRYTKLDDVKVSKDGVLSLEIDHPETTLYFVR